MNGLFSRLARNHDIAFHSLLHPMGKIIKGRLIEHFQPGSGKRARHIGTAQCILIERKRQGSTRFERALAPGRGVLHQTNQRRHASVFPGRVLHAIGQIAYKEMETACLHHFRGAGGIAKQGLHAQTLARLKSLGVARHLKRYAAGTSAATKRARAFLPLMLDVVQLERALQVEARLLQGFGVGINSGSVIALA